MRWLIPLCLSLAIVGLGCSTNQLQDAQKVVHFVAYPSDANGVIVIPQLTDANSAAILAIAADVEKILSANPTASDNLDTIINITAPIVASYGGWSGLAAIIAYNIYQSRKRKK